LKANNLLYEFVKNKIKILNKQEKAYEQNKKYINSNSIKED